MIWSFKPVLGWFGAIIAYPIAERLEKRDILTKRGELRNYYTIAFDARKQIMRTRLAEIAGYAGVNSPYYKDLFKTHKFEPELLRKDSAYLEALPYLTKDIVREQGNRLLTSDINSQRCYKMKTGGSTGRAAHFIYDQDAVDYSAAVTLYARERIGKKKHMFELHFASRFPNEAPSNKWTKEGWKELAMNRSNVYFSRMDAIGLEEMWEAISVRRPHLVHGHPSTIYALACQIKNGRERANAFEVFESSGELLERYQRDVISEALQCVVIDRYGLAEFGIIGYELNGPDSGLQILDSEGWPESVQLDDEFGTAHELVFTGFRNRFMPLLRYRTGDLAKVIEQQDGLYLTEVVGRIHDIVPINGIPHPTHYIMDVLDHRIGGVQEFQIDLRAPKPILRIVRESDALEEQIREKIALIWGDAFVLQFVYHDEFIRVGRNQKFRHVVQP